MVLENPSSKIEESSSEEIQSNSGFCQRHVETKSLRKSKKDITSVKTFYCPKKGFRQTQDYPGSISSQQVHQLPDFQNAHLEGSKINPSSKCFYNFHRPERWLLAHTSGSIKEALPRVFLQQCRLPIQSRAIRPEYSSSHVHKGDISYSKENSRNTCLLSSISRRHPYYIPNRARCTERHRKSVGDPPQDGFPLQRTKIKTSTSENVRMAGDIMGSNKLQVFASPKDSVNVPGVYKIFVSTQDYNKEKHNESTRLSQLGSPKQSIFKTSFSSYNKFDSRIQKTFTGQENSPSTIQESAFDELTSYRQLGNSIGSTSTYNCSADRCLPFRLGDCNRGRFLQGPLSGSMVNKRVGTVGYLSSPVNLAPTECNDSNSLRQPSSSNVYEERKIQESSHSVHYFTDNEVGTSEDSLYRLSIHSGGLQCSCRSTVKSGSNFYRMDTVSRSVQQFECSVELRDRPVCNKVEPQTSHVCFSLSRSKCSICGRLFKGLGTVQDSFSVSSDSTGFEGFGETEIRQGRNRLINHKRICHKTLVYEPAEDSISFISSANSVNTEHGGSQLYSFLPCNTSRVDLIKKAYDLKFPGSNELTTLLAKPLRVSSQRDYQNKFAFFIKYLRDRNINFYKLTLQNVLDFFVYLFYVRNLLPSTIKIYRSALAKPLKVGLNLDIGTPEATELIKAMLLQRPIPPPSAPAWNLHKVLIAINNMEWNLHVTQALQRAAFLLLLATGYLSSMLVLDHHHFV